MSVKTYKILKNVYRNGPTYFHKNSVISKISTLNRRKKFELKAKRLSFSKFQNTFLCPAKRNYG